MYRAIMALTLLAALVSGVWAPWALAQDRYCGNPSAPCCPLNK